MMPLRLRVGAAAAPAPSRPACRGTPGTRRSARCGRRAYAPTAPSPSQTSTRGTAPEPGEQLPPAGEQVLGVPGRDQPRGQPPGVAGHHRQHRQLLGRAGLPEPDRQLDRRGNQKSHCAISPAT